MIKPSYASGAIMIEEKKIPNGLFQLRDSQIHKPNLDKQAQINSPQPTQKEEEKSQNG